jgi:hypothetical protein
MAGQAVFSTLRAFGAVVFAEGFAKVLADGLEDGLADNFTASCFPRLAACSACHFSKWAQNLLEIGKLWGLLDHSPSLIHHRLCTIGKIYRACLHFSCTASAAWRKTRAAKACRITYEKIRPE